MRLLSLLLSVMDWQKVYNIHHAIPHDLGLSITFFCWSLCRRKRIRLRVNHNSLAMGGDVSVCFTGWNEAFLRLKRTVSWHEIKYFIPWNRNLLCHRNAFNDMQYLVECSEKIVRDNPKSWWIAWWIFSFLKYLSRYLSVRISVC